MNRDFLAGYVVGGLIASLLWVIALMVFLQSNTGKSLL